MLWEKLLALHLNYVQYSTKLIKSLVKFNCQFICKYRWKLFKFNFQSLKNKYTKVSWGHLRIKCCKKLVSANARINFFSNYDEELYVWYFGFKFIYLFIYLIMYTHINILFGDTLILKFCKLSLLKCINKRKLRKIKTK